MKANMSIQVLVGIILALVVLVFLVVQLGQTTGTLQDAEKCEAQGGTCVSDHCDGRIVSFICPSEEVCCVE